MLGDLTESRASAAAYAALTELERLAALLPLAPGLTDRVELSAAIARRQEKARDLLERLRDADGAAFTAAIDDARRRVESADWWEALATVALSTPLTDELFAALLGGVSSAVVEGHVARETRETGGATGSDGSAAVVWAAQRLRGALSDDPVLAARIAMWGRRLVGEAIVLAREFGGEEYPALADRLAASHTRRLADLGLDGESSRKT